MTRKPLASDNRRPDTPLQSDTCSDSVVRQAIETGRTRILITATVMTLAFGVLGARLVDLTVLSEPAEPRTAKAASEETIGRRADIVDRNGTLLATSLHTVSLFADPKRVMDPRAAAYKLAAILPDSSAEWLESRMRKPGRFVYLHRSLTPRQQWEINRLGIPGIDFSGNETRLYPHGPLAGHVLGFADVDGNGIAGIEKRFDKTLGTDGKSVALSLDMRVQHILRDELTQAIAEFKAIGAAGIVMDAKSGELLGLSSLPDFDPNHPGDASADARFNRATLGVYELGSTFKIFNTAMAIDSGLVTMNDFYDASKPLKVSRYTIRDYHAKNRSLSVPEIFIYSSNIGSAKMAVDVGGEAQKHFFQRMGFLDTLSVELPEAGHPQSPSIWRPINTMTISFGHGLSVSPLHLASGVAAMVNGGVLMPPTLLKSDIPRKGRRIVSEATSDSIRRLMRLNALEGSGGKARVSGYLVGGKTGTAEKVGMRGTYKRKALISSFVAAFPMNDPKYVVYIVLDEPQGNEATHGYATGGWVAAPTVGEVIRRIAPVLGVTPVDSEAPEIRQQLAIELPHAQKRLASF